MGIPWKSHGRPMEVTWGYSCFYGNIKLPYESHETVQLLQYNIIESPWDFHRISVVRLRRIILFLCGAHGNFAFSSSPHGTSIAPSGDFNWAPMGLKHPREKSMGNPRCVHGAIVIPRRLP